MWDGIWMVLSLGGIMALASFLAGSLPLVLSLSQRQMRLLSAVGTGLLIGTALIVIIPEGIETMYSANAVPQIKEMKSSSSFDAPLKGALAAMTLHGVGPHQQHNEQAGRAEELAQLSGRGLHSGSDLLGRAIQIRAEKAHEVEHHHEHENPSHAWIGIALITGFILMYLIDALQRPAPSRGHHIPLTTLDIPNDEDEDDASKLLGEPKLKPSHNAASTTIGLVIHSFGDGIALGASSADANVQSTLGLVVFIAILVHKAPAAFGLTSVLLKQGVGKRAARAHLLIFSLAAPIGALVTWTLVNLLGSSSSAATAVGSSSASWWTGLMLVFSGGTFLYVAMHAMQETGHHGGVSSSHGGSSRIEVFLMVVGMLFPLLTQIGHAHAHGG